MNPAYAGYQNPRRDMGFEDYLSSSSSFASSPPHCLQRPLLIVVSNVLSSTSSPSATSGRLYSLISHLFSLLIFLF
ncbi:unnamed protein product [Prunus armeniaca]